MRYTRTVIQWCPIYSATTGGPSTIIGFTQTLVHSSVKRGPVRANADPVSTIAARTSAEYNAANIP